MLKRQWVFFIIILPFFVTFFLYRFAISQSSPSARIPKEIAKITLPKLLDFGAGTCIPCKKMAPILQELADEYKGRVIIKVIEVYKERELTRTNGIRLIPTQIFFDAKNQEVYRHVGFMDKEQIKKVFQKMGVNPVRKPSTSRRVGSLGALIPTFALACRQAGKKATVIIPDVTAGLSNGVR